jgi:hypothetical protein
MVFHGGDEIGNQSGAIDSQAEELLQVLVNMSKRIFVLFMLSGCSKALEPIRSWLQVCSLALQPLDRISPSSLFGGCFM